MEEDECDYRTPIGKVIKHINSLCKKPTFDNQLSEAIDVFHVKLNDQEKYLVNGIFRINFAESALFLQSCAEFYGKRIDLLWNELLEFHTRLIKYDCEHQKEKGIPINKQVVERLEERRNRYLRKKTFKLLPEEEVVIPSNQCKIEEKTEVDEAGFLIAEDEKFFDTDDELVSKVENRSLQSWEDIQSLEIMRIPYIVYIQMRRTYRLKNYPLLRGQDYDILDMEDGEFNTKYSRVPGWNHILHLLEYNDQGLLPDSNSAVARTKLALYGRIMFLKSRKLPFDTPMENYKEEYLEFCNQFFRNEAKRWQNMPLDTLEDFRKQLQFLTKMCREQEKNGGCLTADWQYSINDKVEIVDSSDVDSLLELTVDGNKDFIKSDLFVRLEKLSCDVLNTKLRQDSGYYDCNSGSSEEMTQNTEGAEASLGQDVTASIASIDNDNNGVSEVVNNSENISTNIDDSGINLTVTSNDDSVETNKDTDDILDTGFSVNSDIRDSSESADKDDDNFDTRSIASDHDYCMTPIVTGTSADCDSNSVKNKEVPDESVMEIFKKPLGVARIIPRVLKRKELTKKANVTRLENGEPQPKRRKLSQKQLEALLESKIIPVKLLKFEKFFSENYQPEEGEGNVPSVEYDSEESDTEDTCLTHTDETNNNDEQDDVRSIHSDHSYCQTLPEDTRNDSGFVDASQTSDVNEEVELLRSLGVEEEYETLVAQMRERQRQDFEKKNQLVPTVPTREELRELERKESRARVEEWRNTINPILRNLKEKDFDIHQYGSQIIEGMEVNDTKPFKDIVQGKTSAEVVRFFISSLQLANTNNIEICGAIQGQLSNDTYTVKLLSKDRYHEHLMEYMAPSEETLAEKLEKVRAMKAQQEKSGGSKTKQSQPTDKLCKGKKLSYANINKTMTIKVTKLPIQNSSQREVNEVTDNTYQHNKENRNIETPVFSDKTAKGKSIIKRQTNTPHILNFDISQPSTSRHVHWFDQPQSSVVEPQTPSTSSHAVSPPRNSELSVRRSPNTYRASPNKRRRSESSEEAFVEQLAAAQRKNPDIQVHSTPHGPSPSKLLKVSAPSKKSILF